MSVTKHRKSQGKLSRSGKRQEIDEAADGGACRHASILFALVSHSRSTRDQKMERTLRTGTLFRRISIYIFTVAAAILARSLANFYYQKADKNMK